MWSGVVPLDSFIDVGLNSKDSYLRSKFIERITDENYLKLFVLKDNSMNNRSEAIKKISNISFLKEIAFNAKFLLEILNVLKTEEVVFEMSEPNRAGLLVPGLKEDHEELLMLIMPIMLGY